MVGPFALTDSSSEVNRKSAAGAANPASLERLDQRLYLNQKRFVMWCDGGNRAVDTKQRIDGHLRRAHRILNREHDIIRNFDELADEREIFRTIRHR